MLDLGDRILDQLLGRRRLAIVAAGGDRARRVVVRPRVLSRRNDVGTGRRRRRLVGVACVQDEVDCGVARSGLVARQPFERGDRPVVHRGRQHLWPGDESLAPQSVGERDAKRAGSLTEDRAAAIRRVCGGQHGNQHALRP